MPIFKSTNHILNKPFEKMPSNTKNFFYEIQSTDDFDYSKPYSIYDIKMWEQIYYEPGFIGIYVAHNPKIEFYMITYNIFIDKEKGIETFFGSSAVEEVISRANNLGIELPVVTEYVKN